MNEYGSLTVSFQIHFAELQYTQGFKPSFFLSNFMNVYVAYVALLRYNSYGGDVYALENKK